jgi:hypothetical protein
MLGGIGKNQTTLKSKFKNRSHNVQLVNESFGSEVRAAFLNPTVAMMKKCKRCLMWPENIGFST